MKMSEHKWRTKEGQLIPVPEIGDRHLLNIYRMLDRQVRKIKEMTLFWMDPVWGPHGEHAQDAADQAMEEAWDVEMRKEGWMQIIQKEIVRRKLTLPNRTRPKPPPKTELVESTSMGNIHRILEG